MNPFRRLAHALAADRRGLAFIEFALALPLLIGFTLGGLEMANYIIANNTVQRLATMSADIMSQAGINNADTTEGDIWDLFYSLDSSSDRLDLRNRGRIVLTVMKGVTQPNGTVRNEFADDDAFSQQFDGGYVEAAPIVGCHTTTELPTYGRTLPANEIMVHSQVSYRYQPLFVTERSLSYFGAPAVLTRTAVFRMRKNQFNILADGQHASKKNCTSANGL